jgi:hypothetical protein
MPWASVGTCFFGWSRYLLSHITGEKRPDASAAGLRVEEYNHVQNNLTEATEALYSVLTTRGIRLHNSPDLCEHVLTAVSVETPRGIRLFKAEKQPQD